MTSITTFAYGLTVQVPELITASRAWPALEPVFNFFDLLFLRRKQGTLRIHQQEKDLKRSILEKVPVEVWEEVRQWVVVSEMDEEEDKLLRPFAQSCCEWGVELDECDCQAFRDKKLSWDSLRQGISSCFNERSLRLEEEYNNTLFRLSTGSHGSLDPIHRLVAAFGLAHPLPRTIVLDVDEWISLDDIAFVSIPCGAQRRGSYHSTISAKAGYEDQDEQTIIDVSFDLPPDADSRFLRFVRTFNLKVVEISNGTLKFLPPNPDAKPLLQSKLAGIEKGGAKIVKEIKPRWKLYSSCHGDW